MDYIKRKYDALPVRIKEIISILMTPFITTRRSLKWQYKQIIGKELDLKNPKTYTEKLQWLKLKYKNPLYTKMVDKVLAKDYIEEKLGKKCFAPLLGVWDKPEDIDFDLLPDKFVLKTNHNSMFAPIICRDKKTFDKEEAIYVLNENLKRNHYQYSKEWSYKNVKRKVLAEFYLEDNITGFLTDYKFFCFNGVAKFMYIQKNEAEEVYADIFDMDFNHLPFIFNHKNAPVTPSRPSKFDEMRAIAEKLSEGIPHLRVDLYLVNDQVYVGELTFFHCAGLVSTNPPEWDYKIGEMLDLSAVK